MKLKQSYKYTGSSEFTFSVDYSQSGTSLYSQKSGIGGIDFMPSTGDTITVYSNVIGTTGDIGFKPDLNNKIYYLVSNDIITDRSEIISQGTVLSLMFSAGRYEGSFVYSNPNDFEYLYIVSDYTNNIPTGTSITQTFASGDIEVIDIELDSNIGLTEVPYTIPAGTTRIAVEYNGNIVADTGNLTGASSGSISFVRISQDPEVARVVVSKVATPGNVSIGPIATSLTSFFIDPTAGTLSNVCSQVATSIRYHNGTSALPVPGDRIYRDSAGTLPYDGENAYHVISTTSMGAPSSTSDYISINTSGEVLSAGNCTCSEVAVPVITQGDITTIQNQQFSIYVEATNNPNSWELVTTCNEYELDGGIKGAVFSYTDCYSESKFITSSSNQILTVCASALPTVVTGTGTVSLIGPCQETSLPKGVRFNSGIISGTPLTTGRFTVELIASNCFGDSAPVSFDVITESSINLTPFYIDSKNPSDTGADACALTGSYDILYHNGRNRLPSINDTIFIDYKAVDRFVGGKLWYKIDNSLVSVKIDEFGVIIEEHTC